MVIQSARMSSLASKLRSPSIIEQLSDNSHSYSFRKPAKATRSQSYAISQDCMLSGGHALLPIFV